MSEAKSKEQSAKRLGRVSECFLEAPCSMPHALRKNPQAHCIALANSPPDRFYTASKCGYSAREEK